MKLPILILIILTFSSCSAQNGDNGTKPVVTTAPSSATNTFAPANNFPGTITNYNPTTETAVVTQIPSSTSNGLSPTNVFEWSSPSNPNGVLITIKATYNGVTRTITLGPVSAEIAKGRIPRCGDADGVNPPAITTDANANFCYALRLQLAQLPDLRDAARGGPIAAQMVQIGAVRSGSSQSSDLSFRFNLWQILFSATTVALMVV